MVMEREKIRVNAERPAVGGRSILRTLLLFGATIFVGLCLFVDPNCRFKVANADIVRGDTANYLIFTSAIPVASVSIKGYYSSMSTPDFTQALTYIAGSTYSYRAQKTFTAGKMGKWKFEILFTDTALVGAGDDVAYLQWAEDVVYPDTAAYHGSASGLSAQTIWEYIGANATDPGTSRTVNLYRGVGNRLLTTTVRDATTLNPIQGAQVQYKIGTANKSGPQNTLANGTVVSYLQSANTYDWTATHNNYVSGSGTLTLGSPTTDTTHIINLSLFSPGSPPSANVVLVYGTIYDINGAVVTGTIVKADLQGASKVWYKTVAVTPYARQDTTDAVGYWSMNLLPNDSLTPVNTVYHWQFVDTAGVISDYNKKVPGDSSGKSWRFTRP